MLSSLLFSGYLHVNHDCALTSLTFCALTRFDQSANLRIDIGIDSCLAPALIPKLDEPEAEHLTGDSNRLYK